MALYLIELLPEFENTLHRDYVRSMVIRAKTIDECRIIAARNCQDEGEHAWRVSFQSKVTKLDSRGESKVIQKDVFEG